MLFSANRDPRIYFLPPISYVFVLHHTHIVVVSLNCLFVFHAQIHSMIHKHERGWIWDKSGSCETYEEALLFLLSWRHIYIYLYKVTIHPVSRVKKKERYKTEKMQLYVPSLHVLNLRSTFECTCNVCVCVWGHQVVKATLCFVYVHVFFFSAAWWWIHGGCVSAFRGPHFRYSKVFLTFWNAPLRTSTVYRVMERRHESFNGQPTTHIWTWITFFFSTWENICCKRAQCATELPGMLCSSDQL